MARGVVPEGSIHPSPGDALGQDPSGDLGPVHVCVLRQVIERVDQLTLESEVDLLSIDHRAVPSIR
jgi:hypothetical protein